MKNIFTCGLFACAVVESKSAELTGDITFNIDGVYHKTNLKLDIKNSKSATEILNYMYNIESYDGIKCATTHNNEVKEPGMLRVSFTNNYIFLFITHKELNNLNNEIYDYCFSAPHDDVLICLEKNQEYTFVFKTKEDVNYSYEYHYGDDTKNISEFVKEDVKHYFDSTIPQCFLTKNEADKFFTSNKYFNKYVKSVDNDVKNNNEPFAKNTKLILSLTDKSIDTNEACIVNVNKNDHTSLNFVIRKRSCLDSLKSNILNKFGIKENEIENMEIENENKKNKISWDYVISKNETIYIKCKENEKEKPIKIPHGPVGPSKQKIPNKRSGCCC